jgi:hypothetical protein
MASLKAHWPKNKHMKPEMNLPKEADVRTSLHGSLRKVADC